MPVSFNSPGPNIFPAMPQQMFTPIGTGVGDDSPVDFQQMLLDSMSKIGAQQMQANAAIEASLLGEGETQVQAMIALKKSELAFRTMLQIRNKLIDAYNEIKDMRF